MRTPFALLAALSLTGCAHRSTVPSPLDPTPRAAPAPAASQGAEVPPSAEAWQTTASGLKVADLVVGTGEVASAGMDVTVHYTGWLQDGSRFDSSRARGPLEIPLGKGVVIPGWEEGVAGMRVGGTRLLEIPPALGYGDRAVGPVPPGSTLTFEVELLDVRAPRRPPLAPPRVAQEAWRRSRTGLEVAELGGCTGPPVMSGATLLVEYTLWLESGTLIDSSYQRQDPLEVVLGEHSFVEGFEEGLAGASLGCHRLLRVPPDLGYGAQARGPMPANATLLFEVEVIGVK